MRIAELEQYEYISFDIFDTLIKRNVNKPTDLFQIVENEYNKKNEVKISNFKNNRIDAEKRARRKAKEENREEITLEEIYNQLCNFYSLEVCERLKNDEIKLEIDFTQINREVMEVYNCVKMRKKVIITSDMYLPKEVIERILHESGIEQYYKLYLSSEIGKTKQSTNLFKYILKDLNISDKDIVHIGDNEKSDIQAPKTIKINAIKVIRGTNREEYENINVNVLESFIKNNISRKEEYFYKFGYEIFGPLLFGFSTWLKNSLLSKKINKVYFLARDGFIMKKAFDLINDETQIVSTYFYASRRSLIVPSLWKCSDENELFDVMFLHKKTQLKSWLKKVGMDDCQLEKIISKYKLNFEQEYSIEYMKNSKEFKAFLKEIYPLIVQNSKSEYENLCKYFRKTKFEGNVAIVDIGWFGNMQKALEKVKNDNTKITGFYVGLNPNNKNQKNNNMFGYIFDKFHHFENYQKEHYFNSIFEFLFLAQHGSVKKFIDGAEDVQLYKYEYENTEELQHIREIQEGALDFVRNISGAKIQKYIDYSVELATKNIFDFALSPKIEDAINFGNIRFMDDDIFFIAKPPTNVSVKEVIKGFKKSKWRIGYMKRILRIKLPYYEINKILRKIYFRGKDE